MSFPLGRPAGRREKTLEQVDGQCKSESVQLPSKSLSME